MSTYEIVPVDLGSRRAETSLLMYLTDPGRELTINYRLWVLRSAQRTVLVDTGLPIEEAHERGIHDAVPVEEALRGAGVEASDVDTIVLTHLHWDHASNATAFPRATFVTQQIELDWLSAPMRKSKSIARFYSADLDRFHQLHAQGRFRLLTADESPVPGIRTIRVGGHTPGSQIVAVDTPRGCAVLTGDAVPLNRNFLEEIPNGIHVDLLDAIAVFDKIRDLDPTVVYTGHDPESHLPVRAREPQLAGKEVHR